jgi:quercetin dioxygenase-like cupin family protein
MRMEVKMSEHVVEDPVLRQSYVFRPSMADDGTEVLEVAVWVQPGGGVVPHLHPTFEERFEMLDGELVFTVGRRRIRATVGETVVVAPGVRHTYANKSATTAHFRCQARPPTPELQQFLEDAAALGRMGSYTRNALPRTVRGLLQLAVMARHYRATTVILRPPPWLHAVLITPLARLGELRGYRAGEFA